MPFVIAVKRLSAADVGGEDCAKKKKVVDRLLSDRRGAWSERSRKLNDLTVCSASPAAKCQSHLVRADNTIPHSNNKNNINQNQMPRYAAVTYAKQGTNILRKDYHDNNIKRSQSGN